MVTPVIPVKLFAVAALLFMLLPCALIIQLPSALATETVQAYAIVTLNIINIPPSISGIDVLGEPHTDSVLACNATVIDEFPSAVKMRYTWLLNGRPASEARSLDLSIHDARPGDSVECILTPIDIHGVEGNSRSALIKIEKRKGLLGLFDYI